MKIFGQIQQAKRYFLTFLEQNKADIQQITAKPSFSQRFSNVGSVLKLGVKQISINPEIILIYLFNLILIFGIIALGMFSVFTLLAVLDKFLIIDDSVRGILEIAVMLGYAPLIYVLSFISSVSSGAIGITSFLSHNGQQSSIIKNYRIALHKADELSSFKFINTVINYLMLKMMDYKKDSALLTFGIKAVKLAWKFGVKGVAPSLLNGYSIQDSLRMSFKFFKCKYLEIISVGLIFKMIRIMIVLLIIAGIALYSHYEVMLLNMQWLFLICGILLLLVIFVTKPLYLLTLYSLYAAFLQDNKYTVTKLDGDRPIAKSLRVTVCIVIFYFIITVASLLLIPQLGMLKEIL